jgi:Flp pilus assembly protein TadD
LYELAAAEYQRALELEPNYSDVHRFLGRVYALSGQPELALAAYRNAVQNDPGNYRGYVFLGWFYNDMDQFSQAVAPLRQAVALAPDEPDARDQLGFAYKSLGQFQAAEAELRTALQFGETVFVLDQMGETLMYERREEEAIPFFKRALAIDPNEFIALMDLGICYRRLNRRPEWDQANRDGLQAAEAAKRLNPRNGNARAILAYFHSQLGQPQEAESEISQALTFSPDGVGVRWAAALTYEALAKRDATLSLLTSASRELSADLNRWPDLAGLQSDPRFIQLLISNRVQ